MTLAMLALFAFDRAAAQPSVVVKRVVVNPPVIDVYFTTFCSSAPNFDIDPARVRLTENGLDVPETELYCPNPAARCSMAAALVLDASGSMAGPYNLGARAAGRAFVDSMDGSQDQAAVVWFNNAAAVACHPTNDTAFLRRTIDSLPASGGTALWDAAYIGLLQVRGASANHCRAVVLLTDGTDNASTTPAATVIDFAIRNRVRLFMIGLGHSTNDEELARAARLTGGGHFHASDESELTSIFRSIAGVIRGGFGECRISYVLSCADGGEREIILTLQIPCGQAQAAADFTAPLDTTSFKPLVLRLGEATVTGGSETVIPLWIDEPMIEHTELMYPAAFKVVMDTGKARLHEATAPPGCVFEGADFKLVQTDDGAEVVIQNRIAIRTTGLPQLAALLRVSAVGHGGPDTLRCPVSISEWRFSAGCRKPLLRGGVLSVLPWPPSVNASIRADERLRWDCWKDGYEPELLPITLTVRNDGGGVAAGSRATLVTPSDAFIIVHPAAAEQSLTPSVIPPSGTATATWFVKALPRKSSDSIRISIMSAFGNHPPVESETRIFVPASHPALPLEVDGPPFSCEGTGRLLTALPGYSGYIWSTGANTRTIHVTRTGTYWYTAITPMGDRYCSDTVGIISRPLPVPQIVADGSLTFCPGDSLRLYTFDEYPYYRWSTGENSRYIHVRKPGEYSVVVIDSFGCEGASVPINTAHYTTPEPVIDGPVSICRFDTATYAVVNDSGWALRWSVEQGRIEGSSTGSSVRVRWGNSARGILTVTAVSPVTGCSGKTIFQVWLSPGSTPRILPGSVTLCEGDTAILSADTGFVSWRWSDGVTTRVRRVSAPGAFAVEAKDENGCVAVSDSITVTVNDPPAPMLIGAEQVCRGDTSYYISAPTAGNAYGWHISGGSIIASPSPWFVYVAWNEGTRGRVILREQAGSCIGSDTMLVEVASGRKPEVFIDGALRFCRGDSAVLTAEDGFSDYKWSTGEISRSIVVRSSGAYIVRASDGGDCPGWSDSVRVTTIPLPEKPVISRVGDILNASPASAYQWYASDSLLAGETGRSLHLISTGIYLVEAWDHEGCSSMSDPFDVTVLNADPAPIPRRPFISIYPEPHSGIFTVNIHTDKNSELTLRIRDALGRLIASDRCRTEDGRLTRVYRLDKIPSGIYLLEAEHRQGMERIKTIVRY